MGTAQCRANDRYVTDQQLCNVAGASVSGWYFSHPESRYFAIAQIQQDQVEDYAQRKGWDLLEAEKWLGPNING